jgi:guanylate cyclase soluble subunit beta
LDLNAALEGFGAHFFHYTVQSGYDQILRVLGRNLQDFLCNLDALHDHLANIYPGMEAPSFRCTEAEDGALLLHYYTKRSGLESIVVGLVKTICTDILHTSVTVKVLAKKDENGSDHTIFAIYEDSEENSSSKLGLLNAEIETNGDVNANYLANNDSENNPMNVMSFCKAFPFHILFDEDLTIIQAGVAILRVLNRQSANKMKVNEVFTLQRPKLNLSFAPILAHINTVFIMETKEGIIPCGTCGPGRSSCSACAKSSKGKGPKIRLKGQMVHVPESNALLFLCSPRVADLDALRAQGLFLSDLPLHDATRDLIFMTHTRSAERELVEQLEETSNNLKKMEACLIDDKKRTDDLLHSILPPNVAEKLRVDQAVEAENYKLVTILFSDIVGFTALCSNDQVVPMDIVRMLNKLYTYFDMLSGVNEVYKVKSYCTYVKISQPKPSTSCVHTSCPKLSTSFKHML